jgi:hypothetical protein
LDLLVVTAVTALDVATQRRRAAAPNGTQHLMLARRERSAILPSETVFTSAKHIGDF